MKARLAREAIILCAIALLPAIGEGFYFRDKVSWQSSVPASEMVSVEQARSWGDNAIWIDARPDEEFAKDHVPDALQLNEDRWSELLMPVVQAWTQSPEKRVVVYCSSQGCNLSRDVALRLRKETPVQNVFVLQGGWEAWLKSR